MPTLSPTQAPTSPPTATATASPPTSAAPKTGDAEFFFEPGLMQWCGAFESYRAPSATLSGALMIGSTTFAASSGNPAPFRQRIASERATG